MSDPPLAPPDTPPQAPDVKTRRLLRLASAGTILLAGAIGWNALAVFIDFRHSEDGYLDGMLAPLAAAYALGAWRGLVDPNRANPRLLSRAYFTFFGRGALKIVMCAPSLSWFISSSLLAILVACPFAHFRTIKWLMREAPLTDAQYNQLTRPALTRRARILIWAITIVVTLVMIVMPKYS